MQIVLFIQVQVLYVTTIVLVLKEMVTNKVVVRTVTVVTVKLAFMKIVKIIVTVVHLMSAKIVIVLEEVAIVMDLAAMGRFNQGKNAKTIQIVVRIKFVEVVIAKA